MCAWSPVKWCLLHIEHQQPSHLHATERRRCALSISRHQSPEQFFFQEKTPSASFEWLRALLRGKAGYHRDILIVVWDAETSTGSAGGVEGGLRCGGARRKENGLNTEDVERVSRLKAACHRHVEIQQKRQTRTINGRWEQRPSISGF